MPFQADTRPIQGLGVVGVVVVVVVLVVLVVVGIWATLPDLVAVPAGFCFCCCVCSVVHLTANHYGFSRVCSVVHLTAAACVFCRLCSVVHLVCRRIPKRGYA